MRNEWSRPASTHAADRLRDRPDITAPASSNSSAPTQSFRISYIALDTPRSTERSTLLEPFFVQPTAVHKSADSFHSAHRRAVRQPASAQRCPACGLLTPPSCAGSRRAGLLAPLHPTGWHSTLTLRCCRAAAREDNRRGDLTDQLQQQLTSSKGPTDTKLPPEQLQEAGFVLG